jgi:hypothetical protein
VSAAASPWIERVALASAGLLLLILAAPQLALCTQVARHHLRPASAGDTLVRLDLRRAPVLVQRGGGGRAMAELAPVVEYLGRQLGADEGLFTFPDLDLVCFLTGRNNPAQIGYFSPGWPDHVIEAEVVAALTARPPRFMVVADKAPLFFADAPAYYFLLRDFIASHYRLWARAGHYDLLLRDGAEAAPFALAPGMREAAPGEWSPVGCGRADLRECLQRGDRHLVRNLIEQVRTAESASGAAALSEAWASGWLARPELPETAGLLALRAVSEEGDARSGAYLMKAPEPTSQAQRDAVATALFNVAVREMIEPFQFVHLVAAGAVAAGAPAAESGVGHAGQLKAWLDAADTDVRLRFFALWALSVAELPAGDRDGVARAMRRFLDDANPGLQVAAAAALVRLGSNTDTLDRLLRLAPANPSLVPSLAAEWSRRHPETAVTLLSRVLENGDAAQRETAAWIASVLRWPVLSPALQKAAGAREARVRLAAVWALGCLGDHAVLPALRAAQSDSDPGVRSFAESALRQLRGHDASRS